MSSTLQLRLDLIKRDSGLPHALIDRFGHWVQVAPDEELFRVPLIPWAARHGVPEDAAIDLFLHATKAGVMEMSWGVICPYCGVLITTPGGLRALSQDPHCKICRLNFPAAMDDQVEVTFSLEPGIRPLRFNDPARIDPRRDGVQLFFSPSLEVTDVHRELSDAILIAENLMPGAHCSLTIETQGGHLYAVMAPTVHALAFFQATDESRADVIDVDCLDGQMVPNEGGVKPGPVAFHVKNRSDHVLTVVGMDLGLHDLSDFEDKGPPPSYRMRPFLTGKRMLTNQTFRDLFRTETIGESGLRLKNLAMVFSDLQASTALYERVGDIRALELVRQHFEKLGEVVRRHQGAVVKTIGDAVMAAFAEPERALAAAAGMSRAVRRIDADGEHLTLKVGVHAGTCIAIQTNHQIDYFGTAVNIAARVQGVAQGGEIVVTDAIWDSPGVQGLVDDFGLTESRDVVDLRGIARGVPIHRLV